MSDCTKFIIEVHEGEWLPVRWAPTFDTEAEAEAWLAEIQHGDGDSAMQVSPCYSSHYEG